MRETKMPDPIVIDSDDGGSDAELETFSDSADESHSPPSQPKPTTDSSNSGEIVELEKDEQEEISVVKSGSSSPIAIVTEPTRRPPIRSAFSAEPKPGPSYDRTSDSKAGKQPSKQQEQKNHCIPTTASSSTTVKEPEIIKDCTNGNHSSSNGSTEDSASQHKFQFVKQSEPTVSLSSWRDHLGDSKGKSVKMVTVKPIN